MGFAENWIKVVMSCVTLVSYSFIINGYVCGKVNPSRGLGQVDQLSPYPFIMITDGFSGLLNKAKVDGAIHGAHASRTGP